MYVYVFLCWAHGRAVHANTAEPIEMQFG